jgi:hypothetical protein
MKKSIIKKEKIIELAYLKDFVMIFSSKKPSNKRNKNIKMLSIIIIVIFTKSFYY